jgi:hypothetical protein
MSTFLKTIPHPLHPERMIEVQHGTMDELCELYKNYPIVRHDLLRQQLEDIVRLNNGFGMLLRYGIDGKGKTWWLSVYVKVFTDEFVGEGI